MPRYEYHCTGCNSDIVVRHLSDESVEVCSLCSQEGMLIKKISSFSTPSVSKPIKKKVGETTEEFIKNARSELEQQKNELDDKR